MKNIFELGTALLLQRAIVSRSPGTRDGIENPCVGGSIPPQATS
jgi:hypothetical protein